MSKEKDIEELECRDLLVRMLAEKGEPIVLVGAGSTGKSTSISALAKTETVQRLLSERETTKRGNAIPMSIMVTDFSLLLEDALLISGELCKHTAATNSDDNALLGLILYYVARDCVGKEADDRDVKVYRRAIENAISLAKDNKWSCVIKNILRGEVNKSLTFVEILMEFPMEEIMLLYYESQYGTAKQMVVAAKRLEELILKRSSLKKIVEKYWEFLFEDRNQEVNYLIEQLKDRGTVTDSSTNGQDSNIKFMVQLDKRDIGSELVRKLLRNKEEGDVPILSNAMLIFRGRESLFDMKPEQADYYTVIEDPNTKMPNVEKRKIMAMRIVETIGLFHDEQSTIQEEAERIIDLLSQYHSNKLIVTVNSNVTSVTKRGYEAVYMMLSTVMREVEVSVLYTHWDEVMNQFVEHRVKAYDRFLPISQPVEWEEIDYVDAINKQKENGDTIFRECCIKNRGRKPPTIVGFYRAGMLLGINGEMDKWLFNSRMTYPDAFCSIFEDWAELGVKKNDMKYKVRPTLSEMEENLTGTYRSKRMSIPSLYHNLLECKRQVREPAMIQECIHKWCKMGLEYNEESGEVQTIFVREIRNYAQALYTSGFYKPSQDYDIYLAAKEERTEEFAKDIELYLKQHIGREVAKVIGERAAKVGIDYEVDEKLKCRNQCEFFHGMLQYTQENFFYAPQIDVTEQFEKCFDQAINNCVKNFVDLKCIGVY